MKQIFKKLIFLFSLLAFYAHSAKVNKDIEFLNLSVGFQYEHNLSEFYKGKNLKFEGTYTRFTSIFYKKSENKLLFKPRRIGTGTLIIKSTKNKILQKMNIDVKKVNLHKIAKEVSDLLITIDGIEIKILNNKVIIDGEVLLAKEMNRIDTVVDEYKPAVKSLVILSPKAQIQLARLIEKEIGYLTPPNEVRVKVTHNRFILEGEVESQPQRARAELIANLYTQFDAKEKLINVRRKQIHSVTNLIKLHQAEEDSRKTIIQIIIHYVELQKSYNKGFIFQWTPQIADRTSVTAGTTGSSFLTSAITATINNFFPKLNWAKSFNFVRVLHNSNLILEDGKTGNISVDTETPYTARTKDGEISVVTAKSTINTTITPKIIGPRKDTVHMEVKVRVGSLGGATDAGPITNNRSINTSLHVRAGLSAVIGGLISSSLSKDYNRLPSQSVKETPIINLVSSKNYETSKGQFVVFITPIIRGSASSGVDRIKKKFKLDGN